MAAHLLQGEQVKCGRTGAWGVLARAQSRDVGAYGGDYVESLINRAVEAIYDAAPDPSRWPTTLQAIADCFADVGAVMSYQREDGGFGAIASASLNALLDDYVKEFGDQDLRALRGVQRGYYLGRDGLTDLDVVSAEEMEHHLSTECLHVTA
jgi:hypothetical protein